MDNDLAVQHLCNFPWEQFNVFTWARAVVCWDRVEHQRRRIGPLLAHQMTISRRRGSKIQHNTTTEPAGVSCLMRDENRLPFYRRFQSSKTTKQRLSCICVREQVFLDRHQLIRLPISLLSQQPLSSLSSLYSLDMLIVTFYITCSISWYYKKTLLLHRKTVYTVHFEYNWRGNHDLFLVV